MSLRYVLLNVGDVINEGDEVFDTERQEWVPATEFDAVGDKVTAHDNPIRRREAQDWKDRALRAEASCSENPKNCQACVGSGREPNHCGICGGSGRSPEYPECCRRLLDRINSAELAAVSILECSDAHRARAERAEAALLDAKSFVRHKRGKWAEALRNSIDAALSRDSLNVGGVG